jgi:hypothetical protein
MMVTIGEKVVCQERGELELDEKEGMMRLKNYKNKPSGMCEREFTDWIESQIVPVDEMTV